MKKSMPVILTTVALLSISMARPLYADSGSGGGITPAQNSFYTEILKEINSGVQSIKVYVQEIATLLLKAPQNLGNDITAWQGANMLAQKAAVNTKSSNDDLDSTFNSDDTLAKSVDEAFKIDTKGSGDYSGLSAYSLLGTTLTKSHDNKYYTQTYSSDQQKAAKDYIKFLSGSAMPVQIPQGDSIENKQTVNLLRTLQAVASLSAYNLSKVYASRLPVAKVSSLKVNGIDVPGGKISQQGLMKYLMQAKVNNPKWYQEIAKSSPFTAMREGVFMLAAAVSELYQMQQNQQQIIVTQTATNTANLAMAKAMLTQMQKSQAITERAQHGYKDYKKHEK